MQRKHNIKFKLYRLSKMIPIFCMLTFLGILSYAFSVGTIFNYAEPTYAEGESAQSGTVTPQATISIKPSEGQYGAGVDSTTVVGSMGMAYRSHDVTVHAQDVTKYSLNISYADGKDKLALEGSTYYFKDAGGNTPENMEISSWGWAWGDTTEQEDKMTYYTMPQYGAVSTDIATGLLANENTYNKDFTKKLVFGAKFGSQNEPGHYKTSVILSLAATPQQVTTTLDDLRYMHEMRPEICASTLPGESATLTDIRDNNTYVVQKLEDGNCWMLQNLKLTKESIEAVSGPDGDYPNTANSATLNSETSNVAEGSTFTMPETTKNLSDFNSSSALAVYNGPDNAGVTNQTGWQDGFGAYYSSAVASVQSSNAYLYGGLPSTGTSESICPKGWRLPAIQEEGGLGYEISFNRLVGDANTTWDWWNSQYTNNTLGFNNAAGGVFSNVFFPAAGMIANGLLSSVTKAGVYVSTSVPFWFSQDQGIMYGWDNWNGSGGLSVRCLASTYDIDVISTMQELTPEICENMPMFYTKLLTDTRDGNTYPVVKLDDQNCWMTQSLRLTRESVEKWKNKDGQVASDDGIYRLNSETSDVDPDSAYELPASSLESFKNGYNSLNAIYYNTTQPFIYGAYYSWCAATAGTCSGVSVDNVEASGSICPRGWRLPSQTSSTGDKKYKWSFNRFLQDAGVSNNADGYTKIKVMPYNFAYLAGYIYSGSLLSFGDRSYFWSSTISSDQKIAYNLGIAQDSVNPYEPFNLYAGSSIRCVAPSSSNL